MPRSNRILRGGNELVIASLHTLLSQCANLFRFSASLLGPGQGALLNEPGPATESWWPSGSANIAFLGETMNVWSSVAHASMAITIRFQIAHLSDDRNEIRYKLDWADEIVEDGLAANLAAQEVPGIPQKAGTTSQLS